MNRPPLVINSIDFNEVLDKERNNLHFRIYALRMAEYFAHIHIMPESPKGLSMIQWFHERSNQIFGLPSIDNYMRKKVMENRIQRHDTF